MHRKIPERGPLESNVATFARSAACIAARLSPVTSPASDIFILLSHVSIYTVNLNSVQIACLPDIDFKLGVDNCPDPLHQSGVNYMFIKQKKRRFYDRWLPAKRSRSPGGSNPTAIQCDALVRRKSYQYQVAI
jgi:hypothetical protein